MVSAVKRLTLTVLPFLVAFPAIALAHDGELDKLGCHHDRKAGSWYHCHRGPLEGRVFLSKEEALKALGLSAKTSGISGKPDIVDGDTIEIAGQRIDLYGIDAPEAGQTCTAYAEEWFCGQEATWALAYETASHWVTCYEKGRSRYGRIAAVCYMGNIDLNALMVFKGWALAYREHSMDYVDKEEFARKTLRGIWRGEFTPPWEWRHERGR